MAEADDQPSNPPVQTRSRSTVIIVVGATLGLQGLTMITGIITARLLGVEGRGVIALVFAVGLMSSQLSFGGSLPVAIAKNLSERGLAARDGLRSIARRRFALLIIPCLVSGGLMLVLQRTDSGGDKYALAIAVVIMTFQNIAYRVLIGCLQGEVGHLGRMAIVALLPQFLFTVLLGTAWIAGWRLTALGALALFFAGSLLGLAIGTIALARPTRRPEDELDEAELLLETRRTYVSSVRPIDSLGLERILVGGLLGNIPLGLYAAALALSSLCSAVGNGFSVIVLPQVAMRHADPLEQRAVIRRWLTVTAVIMVLVVIVLELIAAPAIRIAFGAEFEDAIPVARWLIVADALLGFRKVQIAVLQGQGRGGTASWIELALTPIMIAAVVLVALGATLPAIAMAMASIAAISCSALGMALARGGRGSGDDQAVEPPPATAP